MSQPQNSDDNKPPLPELDIQQQIENSTLGGGMQAAIGDSNIQIQGDSNVITFNRTEILQISVNEIKTRKFIETSPYKGLKKFESEDKDLFFGRDQFLKSLVNELKQTNLVLLLGASGSGKSSVVRAGLVPWLFQKYGTRLVNLIFTPDQDPFESLYASLLSKNTQNIAQFAREAKADTLTQVVTRLKQADDYWFILIDQFEELFTTSQPEKRDRFITSLVELAKAKLLRVKIIVTMRADFLDKLSPYAALVKATDKHRPMIAEMQLDELRLAIEQPAAHHGVVFETGLVEEMIKDVQGQAGYLPLLQYTLNLLWETEIKTGSINDRTLNISTYRELGGVRGALQQRVDKIYEDLSAQEKIATQRIFLKLVDIGGDEDSGTEWKPVRRRALCSEFSSELEQGVLVKLINNNLLVSDRPEQSQESTIEIVHETLLTSWTMLNDWIKEHRNSIDLRNRLNDDVRRWKAPEAKAKAEDELWRGSKLEKVLELKKDETFNQVLGGFSETANQFIDDSLGLRDRRRRRTILGLTGFSVTALLLAGIAGWQWQRSQIGQAEALSTSSTALFTTDQLTSLLEALRAARQVKQTFGVNNEVRSKVVFALTQAVYSIKEYNRLEKHQGRVHDVSFSSDGKMIASVSGDGTLRLWDTNGRELKVIWGHRNTLKGVAISPNGKLIASVGEDGSVKFWKPDGQAVDNLNGHIKSVTSIRFSPDGKTIASVSNDGTLRLWNLEEQESLTEILAIKGANHSISFSPDGKFIASTGEGLMVLRLLLWRINTKMPV